MQRTASFGDIIPLASRRPASPSPSPPALATRRRWESLGGAICIALLMGGIGGLGVLCESRARSDLAPVPAAERSAIVRRAHAELEATCRLSGAASGVLRDHCVETARFVLLFPECDAACAQTARALLPRARK